MVRSHALLVRGRYADAETTARHALTIARRGSLPFAHAEEELTLSRALEARGLGQEAEAARSRAIAILQAKGHGAAAEWLTRP